MVFSPIVACRAYPEWRFTNKKGPGGGLMRALAPNVLHSMRCALFHDD